MLEESRIDFGLASAKWSKCYLLTLSPNPTPTASELSWKENEIMSLDEAGPSRKNCWHRRSSDAILHIYRRSSRRSIAVRRERRPVTPEGRPIIVRQTTKKPTETLVRKKNKRLWGIIGYKVRNSRRTAAACYHSLPDTLHYIQ